MTITQFIPSVYYDTIGFLGFTLYVLNYTLLTTNKLRSEHVSYFAINCMAASLVLIGLPHSFNLASALIQVFWIAISSVGIMIRLRRRRLPVFVSHRAAGAITSPPLVAPWQGDPRSPDVCPKIRYPDQEFGKRTVPPGADHTQHAW